MEYAVCNVPVSAVRKEPLHTAEMVTQQLFGECCVILTVADNWLKIKCKYDAYEGWCLASHLTKIDEKLFLFQSEKLTPGYVNNVYYNGKNMCVPFGSSLTTFKKHKAKWQNDTCIYKGEIYIPSEEKISKKSIRRILANYLNTPYLWGGKSVFGIDCSGLSQSVYKFLSMNLPRDSWQQAEKGVAVKSLQKAQCGDLCFFSSEEGKIVHVGILLSRHKIIHASGKVRIDGIDEKGIINSDTGQRTHSLKIIKRYFDLAH